MCSNYIEEKRELIEAILKDRQLSNLPKITQVFSSSLYELYISNSIIYFLFFKLCFPKTL